MAHPSARGVGTHPEKYEEDLSVLSSIAEALAAEKLVLSNLTSPHKQRKEPENSYAPFKTLHEAVMTLLAN
jgi:hypothetical protein